MALATILRRAQDDTSVLLLLHYNFYNNYNFYNKTTTFKSCYKPNYTMNQLNTRSNGHRIMPLLLILSLFFITTVRAQQTKDPDVIGRWDLTVDRDGKATPSWLEVQKSGYHRLIGRFVSDGGSARPI
jgi:hypothetical protein